MSKYFSFPFKIRSIAELFSSVEARFMKRQQDTRKGIYMYGDSNDIPQILIKYIANCAPARVACSLRGKYIAGKGFKDEKAANFVVNIKNGKPVTANQLLKEISTYSAMFGGAFALYIKRNGKGVKYAEVTGLELLRRRIDGDIEMNPLWGQSGFKDADTLIYPSYTETGERLGMFFEDKEKTKPLGEILYVYNKDAISYYYPIPEWFAGEFDLRSAISLSQLDLEMIENGFMPSAWLTFIGENFDTETEEGRRQKADIDTMIRSFTGRYERKDGTTGRGSIGYSFATTKDEAPIITPFDNSTVISGTIEKRDDVERKVSRWFEVNPVLLGYDAATTLGNTQALANAEMMLNNSVKFNQELIIETFEMLYPEIDWSIEQFRNIDYIPQQVYNTLTDDEIRATAGYEPLDETQRVEMTSKKPIKILQQ